MNTGECLEILKEQRLEVMEKGDRHIKRNSIEGYKSIIERKEDKKIAIATTKAMIPFHLFKFSSPYFTS